MTSLAYLAGPGSFSASGHRLRRGALPQSVARRQANRHPRRAYATAGSMSASASARRRRSNRANTKSSASIAKQRGKIADDHLRAMKTDLDHASIQLRRTLRQFHRRRDLSEAVATASSAAVGRRLDRSRDEARRCARRRWLPAWLLPEDIGKRFRELKDMAAESGA